MQHAEIVSQLSRITDPSEVIFTVTKQDFLTAIVRRMGHVALSLTTDDLELALDEVKVALEHHLDIREYIDIGLDAWEITRKL